MEITHKFELSDKAFELLKELSEGVWAEYRDPEFRTVEEFREKNQHDFRTEESFLARNHNGTFHLIEELCEYNLVDLDFDSWHQTYGISELGREIVRQTLSAPIEDDVQTLRNKIFIVRSREKHGLRYDYSQSVYITSQTPITIICSVHGPYQQLPNSHLRGSGCQKCANDNMRVIKLKDPS